MYNSNMNSSRQRGNPWGGAGGAGGMSASEEMMERDNQDSINRLSDSVRGLKEVCTGCGTTCSIYRRLAHSLSLVVSAAIYPDWRLHKRR